jgi:hypothetical protein
MPYDPMTTSRVTVAQMEEVAKAEGVTFRRGDILLLRFGFTKAYYAFTDDERLAVSKKQETLLVDLVVQVLVPRVGFISAAPGLNDLLARSAFCGESERLIGATVFPCKLRDNHFAAIASDQPAIEEWPDPANNYLHQVGVDTP